MGSTGSGNFTDYKGYSSNNPKQGGISNENDCKKAFRTHLEDVDISEYFINHGNLPPVNGAIVINFNGVRIVASYNDEEIGNLPTKFNYLRKCLEEFTYTGLITVVSNIPVNSITISASPNE